MRKAICVLLCAVCLLSCASAEQEVQLPDSRYLITLPDGMRYSEPDGEDLGFYAYISPTLEMDYTSYPRETAGDSGAEDLLEATARDWTERGVETEIRTVSGIRMICYRVKDEADGAPGIGYLFEDGDRLVAVVFWYSNQEAADLTGQIISSIHEKP